MQIEQFLKDRVPRERHRLFYLLVKAVLRFTEESGSLAMVCADASVFEVLDLFHHFSPMKRLSELSPYPIWAPHTV